MTETCANCGGTLPCWRHPITSIWPDPSISLVLAKTKGLPPAKGGE